VNPFRDIIVASPWEAPRGDVAAIHSHVYDECLRGLEQVRQTGHSTALLIHGEAGSGKTHLLGRLRASLTPQQPSATNRQESLFVWVRLQTSPRMIWRTLRRTLVDDWFRPVAGKHSQFARILFHRLAEIRVAEGDLELWYEYMLDEHPEGLEELLERIATSLDLDRNTAVAFKHIAFGRHLRELRGWLAGTSLPQAALDRLDLAQEDGADEEREDQSRQIVLMLCRLAGDGLPILLSFDQVEALQMAPGDRDALFAFGQLASTLHDSTSNVLLVSCVQSAFAAELKDHARSADYDRMTSFGALSLDPLSRAQAEQLILRRRETTGEPILAGDERPDCWPLEPGEFDDLFAKGFVTPRRLLGLCAERYDQRERRPGGSGDEAAPPKPTREQAVATFLAETWKACLAQKRATNSAERTEEIIVHGLPLLVKLVLPDFKLVRDELLHDVLPVFEGPTGRVGVSDCSLSNMNSLAAKFKRLKSQFTRPRLERLVLVRDARTPLSPSAKQTQKYFADLQQQGAVVVDPTVETLAALDALRELLSEAKAGDLAADGEVVPPPTVETWLTANLPPGLREFAAEVCGSLPAGETGLAIGDKQDLSALVSLPARIAVSVEPARGPR
jgi:hypothetical protein